MEQNKISMEDKKLIEEFNQKKQEVMRRVVSAVSGKVWYDKRLQELSIPVELVDIPKLQYVASKVGDMVVEEMEQNNELERAFEQAYDAVSQILK